MTNSRIAVLLAVAALAGCCGDDDAACTQAQYNALAGVIARSPAPYQPYAPQPVFVGCNHTGTMVNCIAQ